MSAAPKLTVDDLLLLGDDVRAELIDGVILPKAMSSPEHCIRQNNLIVWLRRFHRNPGGRWPGGWWIGPEIHVIYERHQVYCHDIAGWRRDRAPDLPTTRGWAEIKPDWVCELLSPGHEKRDLHDKMVTLNRRAVPHYWIVDRSEKLLYCYRHSPDGYVLVCTAGTGETLRVEPFAEVELRTAVLFGDEDDEE